MPVRERPGVQAGERGEVEGGREVRVNGDPAGVPTVAAATRACTKLEEEEVEEDESPPPRVTDVTVARSCMAAVAAVGGRGVAAVGVVVAEELAVFPLRMLSKEVEVDRAESARVVGGVAVREVDDTVL